MAATFIDLFIRPEDTIEVAKGGEKAVHLVYGGLNGVQLTLFYKEERRKELAEAFYKISKELETLYREKPLATPPWVAAPVNSPPPPEAPAPTEPPPYGYPGIG